MNRIDLELKLKEIDPSSFQRLGDYLLEKNGFNAVSFGNCEGKNVVRKGTPDSYILNETGNELIFVNYTVQSTNLESKIVEDLKKCFRKAQTFKEYLLKEIFFFFNTNNVDLTTIDKISNLCSEKGIGVKFFFMSDICRMMYCHKSVVKEIFGSHIDDDFAYSLDEFIAHTKVLKGVNHSFKYVEREKDEASILDSMNKNTITILTGEPGVGKSMLAVQIAKKYSKNVFCVRTSNENSLDNVSDILNKEEKALLLVDDINEISSFARFLDRLVESEAKQIKMICTVRGYALSRIERLLEKYSFSHCVITIERLNDYSIKRILIENLSITNALWLDKIVNISRGNPRLAIMAGNVAVNNGVNNLIDSKSIMRKYFELATNDTVKQAICNFSNVLGFIAFVRKVDLMHLSSYKDVLKLFGISEDDVKLNIDFLNSLEIISLYEDSVAQIEDQNLSDYIIEKALIDLKICSISDLITQLIKTKRNEIVESLNIILTIYSNESSRQYVESEALKAWKALENTADFDCFIKVFYPFDVSKTLLYLKTKIASSYPICDGGYNKFEKVYDRNDYVDILTEISNKQKYTSSFQLLLLCLDYKYLRDYAFEAIKRSTDLRPSMFSKDGVSNERIFEIIKYKEKPWFDYVLQKVIEEGLKYEFTHISLTKDSSMEHIRLQLNDRIYGLGTYRNKLWKLSFLLTDKSKYALIDSFKYKYPGEQAKETFRNDVESINSLIKSIKEINIIKEELFKVQMLDVLKKFGN